MSKYIIELEQIKGTDLYRAKGSDTLVFDENGIKNILTPYTGTKKNPYGFKVGEKIEVSDDGEHWHVREYRGIVDNQIIVVHENGCLYSWKYTRKVKEVDWSKVPIDTPILVRDYEDEEWQRRYFAEFKDGYVCALDNGMTSWTATHNAFWKYAKLAEESER